MSVGQQGEPYSLMKPQARDEADNQVSILAATLFVATTVVLAR